MSPIFSPPSLTVVVHRRVKPGHEAEFEVAMGEFTTFAASFPGHRGIAILRPGDKDAREYVIVDHFDDLAARQLFKNSPAYGEWMHQFRELSLDDPNIEELEGLASWFTLPERSRSVPPPKWKMGAVTFLGVYPLTSFLPRFFAYLLPGWPPLALNLVVTAVVVSSLTWAIMPFLTRRLAPWLFTRVSSPPLSS
jgi:antibiotic biosynthesis monooxygenase (ABM) superfamily enzyme